MRNLACDEDALLTGNTTAVGRIQDATSNGTAVITKNTHGLDALVAAGDLLFVTDSSTAGDIDFYEIQSADANTITVDRALAGSDSDVDFTVYKDVVGVFLTDGTNGQIITGFSHQDKPLQLGGITYVATSYGLTSRDVLIAGTVEFVAPTYHNSTLNIGPGICLAYDSANVGSLMIWNYHQTLATSVLLTGSAANSWIVCEKADAATDFLNPWQTDPTLIFQSADATKIYEGGYYNWNSITGKAIGAVAAAGADFTITAQAGGTSGDRDGGKLILWGGAKGNAGADGYVSVGTPASNRGCDVDSLFVAGVLEVDGAAYFDGYAYFNSNTYFNWYTYLGDDILIGFGSLAGGDARIIYSTAQTPDSWMFGVPATSNALVVCELADYATDFAHAQQTNPTLFIQSADATDVTQWISLAHDQADGRILTGKGNLSIGTGNDSHTLTTPNDLFVTGKLEVDGTSYFDGFVEHYSNARWQDDYFAYFGTAGDAGIKYSTNNTPNTMLLALSVDSRAIIACDMADSGLDHKYPLQTNPTIALKSADAYHLNEIAGIRHDGTDLNIDTYKGSLSVTQTASRADGYFTLSGIPVANETFTIGANTYTWKAAAGAPFEITIGGDAATCVDNMVTVINTDDTAGVEALDYGSVCLLRADATGFAGNAITTTEGCTNMTVSDATLTGGQDGGGGGTVFGSGKNAAIEYDTTQTPDSWLFGVPALSNALIVCEKADMGVDFAHAQQTNPTLFIQSADATDVTQWIGICHDQTNAAFTRGKGIFSFDAGIATAGGIISGINAQTGTTYTPVLGDAGKVVTLDNANPIAVTVPLNAAVAYPIGINIDFFQKGAGKVTFAGDGGVTVSSRGGCLSIADQYVGVTLIKMDTDTWYLVGDLKV